MTVIHSRKKTDPFEQGELVMVGLQRVGSLVNGKTRSEVQCLLEGVLIGMESSGTILAYSLLQGHGGFNISFKLPDGQVLYTTVYVS